MSTSKANLLIWSNFFLAPRLVTIIEDFDRIGRGLSVCRKTHAVQVYLVLQSSLFDTTSTSMGSRCLKDAIEKVFYIFDGPDREYK